MPFELLGEGTHVFPPILFGSRESMAAFELLCETFPDENCVLTNREILLEVSTPRRTPLAHTALYLGRPHARRPKHAPTGNDRRPQRGSTRSARPTSRRMVCVSIAMGFSFPVRVPCGVWRMEEACCVKSDFVSLSIRHCHLSNVFATFI